MKVAVSCQGPDLESRIDPRFGRAPGFQICDTEEEGGRYLSNERNAALDQGAGIQAAQDVAGTGAQALITGHVGPKAFTALARGGISVYLLSGDQETCTVRQVLDLFRQGALPPAQGPDRAGHQ